MDDKSLDKNDEEDQSIVEEEVKHDLPPVMKQKSQAAKKRKVKTKRRSSARRTPVEQLTTDTDAGPSSSVEMTNQVNSGQKVADAEAQDAVEMKAPHQLSRAGSEVSVTSLTSYNSHILLMAFQKKLASSKEGRVMYSVVTSMLHGVDMADADWTRGRGTPRPSSSRSTLSVTSDRGSQSDVAFSPGALPGTPIPSEWPVESYCPIIRSSVIDTGNSSTQPDLSVDTRQQMSSVVETLTMTSDPTEELKQLRENRWSPTSTPSVCLSLPEQQPASPVLCSAADPASTTGLRGEVGGNSLLPQPGVKTSRRKSSWFLCGLGKKSKKGTKDNQCPPTPSQEQTPAANKADAVTSSQGESGPSSSSSTPCKPSFLVRMFNMCKALAKPFTKKTSKP